MGFLSSLQKTFTSVNWYFSVEKLMSFSGEKSWCSAWYWERWAKGKRDENSKKEVSPCGSGWLKKRVSAAGLRWLEQGTWQLGMTDADFLHLVRSQKPIAWGKWIRGNTQTARGCLFVDTIVIEMGKELGEQGKIYWEWSRAQVKKRHIYMYKCVYVCYLSRRQEVRLDGWQWPWVKFGICDLCITDP